MSFPRTPPPQSLPRNLPQTWHGHESKSDDEFSVPNVNRNIPKTAQTRLRKSGGATVSSSIRRFTEVKNLNVHQQQNIDPETYIVSQEAYLKRDPMMKKFYGFIRSKLNSLFISLFASDGGFVEKSVPTHLATTLFQGAASLSPPIPAAVANVAAKASQVYHNQKHSNRVEKAVEVCLDPYLATEYARRTAIRLCEIYEDQIKELKEEGPERLARFAITACHDFLEENALVVDQPIPEQLVKAIQEKGAEKRSIPTKISTKAAQKAERYKPSKKIVNFFRFTHLELPTKKKYFFEGKKKDWKADKLFSRCGIRVREGDQWVYYGNDNGQDNRDTGERYTRTELYGFRVGTEKEAKYFGMKELKEGIHPSRFPETIIDFPLSREKSNRGYLIGVWEAFAENCVQEMAEQNEYLFQHGGDIEQIRQEQEELRGFIKRVLAFLEQLTQELVEQGKNLSQNSESLERIQTELGKLPDLVNAMKTFSENCMQAMEKQGFSMQEEMRKISTAIEKLVRDKHPSIPQRDVNNVQQGLQAFYSLKKNFQLAFSGRTLEIKESFVQLAIIEEVRERKNGERKKEGEQLRETMLETRETVHAIKKPVALETLFDLEHRKFLLLGQAGVGKSTLCQKIAHMWATEGFWRDHFSYLFWVPLRNLTQQQYPHGKQDLENILAKECFSKESEEEKLHLIEDIKEILNNHSDEVLMILDGYDETTQMPDAIHEELFARAYRGQGPYVIATSRPYAIKIEEIKREMDATLENRGFTEKHTQEYIVNYFEQDQSKSAHLNDFIKQHRDLATMAQTPLLLEMLCLLWEEEEKEGKQLTDLTMTELYHKAVKKGFRGYFLRQKAQARLLQREYTPKSEKQKQQERERFSLALGKVALEGLKSGQFLIDGKLIENSLSGLNIVAEEFYLNGFLNPVEGDDREWKPGYFMHLTIQEYFAAFYLATKESEAKKTMTTYKYKPHMQIVWTMCAGLLGSKNFGDVGEEGEVSDEICCQRVCAFFAALHEEPHDLIGRYHNRLAVACLNACPDRGNLYNQIEKRYKTLFILKGFIQLALRKPSLGLDLSLEFRSPSVMKYCLRQIIERLGDKDEYVRRRAAKTLGGEIKIKDPAVVLALIEKLGDKDWSVRRGAAYALGKIKDPAVVVALIERLGDKDENMYVRRAAAEALGEIKIKDPAVVVALIERLGDKDENMYVRRAAAYALGEIKDPAAVEPLIERLGDKDENWNVRSAAAKALGEIKDPAAVESLIERLGDKDEYVRSAAAKALGEIKDPAAVVPLIKRFGDKNEVTDVREAAVKALGEIKIKDPAVVLALIERFGDKNEVTDVREAAAKALGKIEIKDPAAVVALIERFGDKNEVTDVREAAAKALGEIKDTAAVVPLIERFGDKNEVMDVREAAAKALGEIKDTDAVVPLIKMLGDKDENKYIRSAAARALGEIKDPATVVPLIKRLGDKDEYVRWAAAEALGKIKDPATVRPLIERLSDKDEDWCVRWAAAKALGEIKDPAAVVALIERLDDKDENKYIRRTAVKALGKIEIKDPAAVVALIKRLDDKDEDVRRAAAEALGEIKDPAAVAALIERLGDWDWWGVKEAAANTLEKMEYKSLLTSALNSNQTKVLAVVVKRALLNNHPLFLCRSEQNEYNLKCGREQMLISEREKTWIKKGLNRALSKELGGYGCIIL